MIGISRAVGGAMFWLVPAEGRGAWEELIHLELLVVGSQHSCL
jgi:hypothetical protein